MPLRKRPRIGKRATLGDTANHGRPAGDFRRSPIVADRGNAMVRRAGLGYTF